MSRLFLSRNIEDGNGRAGPSRARASGAATRWVPTPVMSSIGSPWVQTPRHGDPMCTHARHGYQFRVPADSPAPRGEKR
jgi:hypothetical protein